MGLTVTLGPIIEIDPIFEDPFFELRLTIWDTCDGQGSTRDRLSPWHDYTLNSASAEKVNSISICALPELREWPEKVNVSVCITSGSYKVTQYMRSVTKTADGFPKLWLGKPNEGESSDEELIGR